MCRCTSGLMYIALPVSPVRFVATGPWSLSGRSRTCGFIDTLRFSSNITFKKGGRSVFFRVQDRGLVNLYLADDTYGLIIQFPSMYLTVYLSIRHQTLTTKSPKSASLATSLISPVVESLPLVNSIFSSFKSCQNEWDQGLYHFGEANWADFLAQVVVTDIYHLFSHLLR